MVWYKPLPAASVCRFDDVKDEPGFFVPCECNEANCASNVDNDMVGVERNDKLVDLEELGYEVMCCQPVCFTLDFQRRATSRCCQALSVVVTK